MNTENPREQRGLLIAATVKLVQGPDGVWQVPSQSKNAKYAVRLNPNPSCTCPDHSETACKCKHIFAVECVIRRETTDGGVTVSSITVISQRPRRTYPQNWPAYNEAQMKEKTVFQSILRDLCIDLDKEEPVRRGRPRVRMSDAVFAMAYKVYCGTSARRFTCDLEAAREKGYVSAAPHYNSVINSMDDPDLQPVLSDLIVRSSLPLKGVEVDFAVDSTGFGASRFDRWYDHKWGKEKKQQVWLKCHLICGVKTNIVTAAVVENRFYHDVTRLPALVETTGQNFEMREVSADKAYLSKGALEAIHAQGAMPFIPFKSNSKPKGPGLYTELYCRFRLNQEEFFAHYHKRSNVESTVSMIKAKFRDHLFSKTDAAMVNEGLCKVLCHNICCLIGAIYELGMTPNFNGVAKCA